jgi:uncharacterized protein YcbK (DUF882 family)
MPWSYVKNFTPREKWGSATAMNGLLILLLQAIRDHLEPDEGIVIHCGYEASGHAADSQHKQGNAVDFHIRSARSLPEQSDRLCDILKKLQVFDRVGLGIYPDWNSPGFHLDVRGTYARWGRIGPTTYVGYGDALEHAKKKAAAKP